MMLAARSQHQIGFVPLPRMPGMADSVPHKIGADAWFDRDEARYYEVQEQTVRVGDDRTLTLVTLIQNRMLEDR